MFEKIISIENLLQAWQEFLPGKKNKRDVALFALHLSFNIYNLHEELKNKLYTHGPYVAFKINDPKPRDIHKASVRDRLLHHAIHRVLYSHFDKKFIFDSYSSRLGKGTHKAGKRFSSFAFKTSSNHTKTVWVLKCDIKKFFASINHEVLRQILAKHISCPDMRWLLSNVINSFSSTSLGTGLPLGNLTSQLLVNIYMNEFDQFVKHELKTKYYVRYADDFVILSHNRSFLPKLFSVMRTFLDNRLKLSTHPTKCFIKTLGSGLDFLGWVHFPDHRVLRTSTKRRMFKNLAARAPSEAVINSYLGLLGWGNAYKFRKRMLEYTYDY